MAPVKVGIGPKSVARDDVLLVEFRDFIDEAEGLLLRHESQDLFFRKPITHRTCPRSHGARCR
jgi:hypothetical protein